MTVEPEEVPTQPTAKFYIFFNDDRRVWDVLFEVHDGHGGVDRMVLRADFARDIASGLKRAADTAIAHNTAGIA